MSSVDSAIIKTLAEHIASKNSGIYSTFEADILTHVEHEWVKTENGIKFKLRPDINYYGMLLKLNTSNNLGIDIIVTQYDPDGDPFIFIFHNHRAIPTMAPLNVSYVKRDDGYIEISNYKLTESGGVMADFIIPDGKYYGWFRYEHDGTELPYSFFVHALYAYADEIGTVVSILYNKAFPDG